jgi:hypothetical protein
MKDFGVEWAGAGAGALEFGRERHRIDLSKVSLLWMT